MIYKHSGCTQISIGCERKPCVNIAHGGFLRVFQRGEKGLGFKKVNKVALQNPV